MDSIANVYKKHKEKHEPTMTPPPPKIYFSVIKERKSRLSENPFFTFPVQPSFKSCTENNATTTPPTAVDNAYILLNPNPILPHTTTMTAPILSTVEYPHFLVLDITTKAKRIYWPYKKHLQ